MKEGTRTAQLIIRLRGPAVRDGRILLHDLVHFGGCFQTILNRVALVLATGISSTQPGRRPEPLRSACALELVTLKPGSLELTLELRDQQLALPGMHPGEEALQTLVIGINKLKNGDGGLPPGYDLGVLSTWREAGKILHSGVEAIDLELSTITKQLQARYDLAVHQQVVECIRGPILGHLVLEGRLLMADFRELGTRCRIHPPTGKAVMCDFDESLAAEIQENLRSFVRLTGAAERDPDSGSIVRLKIAEIQRIEEVTTEAGAIGLDEFWRSSTLEELASEQGVSGPQPLDELLGAGAGLWDTDQEFESFVSGIYERRRESRGRG